MREADLRQLTSSVRRALNPELFRIRKLYRLRGWDVSDNHTIKLTEGILTQLNKANQTLNLRRFDVMKLILLLWEFLRNIHQQLFEFGLIRGSNFINIRAVSHNLEMAYGIPDVMEVIIDLKKHVLDERLNVISLEITMEDIPNCLHTIETALSGPKVTIHVYAVDIMRDIKLIRYGLTHSGFTSLRELSIF